MTELRVPDACSLSQPAFEDRLAWIRAEVLPHVQEREVLDDGVAWRFADEPELRAKLERLVALESDCCNSDAIRFELHAPSGHDLRLEVHGVDPGHPLLRGPAADAGRVARVAKAGGLGAVGAFVLFCVVPMGIAAIAGAAVAAPLAGLESPFTLAAGSLAFGAVAWWMLRRREAGKAC